ncbi:hypothetical protein [Nannocystis exedens]|uniref:hypothetical protein n=1 Tax=Nannocystis exedens TaxID=54 RepID=UPI001160DDEE|nr:hypothetical protein [Nannocystis exedens]
MDLDRLEIQLKGIAGEDLIALRAQLLAALQACAADSLAGRAMRIEYDDDAEQFSIFEYVLVTPDNVAAAQAFCCDLEPGEEIGCDLWTPSPEYTVMGIDLESWRRFRVSAHEAFRRIVAEFRASARPRRARGSIPRRE